MNKTLGDYLVIIKRFALIFLTLVGCKTDLKKVQFRNDK